MPTVLLTAFEPYDRWPENASWLALVDSITYKLKKEYGFKKKDEEAKLAT